MRIPGRFTTPLSIGLLAALAVACRVAEEAPPPMHRLMTDEPAGVLVPTAFTQDEPVFRWSFREPADLEPWAARNADEKFAIEADALVIASSGSDPYFWRDVDLTASSLDALEIRTNSDRASLLQLYWAGEDGAFGEQRKATARAVDEEWVRIDLGTHRQWYGTIRKLRIDPTYLPGHAIRIREIVGVRSVLDSGSLSKTLSRSWEVELDQVTRSSRLAPPGYVAELETRIPGASRLELAYGMMRVSAHGESKESVRFRVRLDTQDQTGAILLDTSLAPGEAEAYRWHEATVDLSAWAGSEATIVFETSSGSPDLPGAMPVWGHPRIVSATQRSKPPSVILISLDTLRADHLSLYGYSRRTSPRIDAWARTRGVTFENAVVQAPWTLPSHLSLFTGIDAVRHGVQSSNDRAPRSLRLLAEILRDAGWRTTAITGGGYMAPEFGLTQGFDTYHSWGGAPGSREIETGIGNALRFVEENRNEPFFLLFHTYEIHTPYRARSPHYEQWDGPPVDGVEIDLHPLPGDRANGFVKGNDLRWSGPRARRGKVDLDSAIAMYDSGIAHADGQVAQLLDRLRGLGLEDDTLVILTSDHGESFGEHGSFGHGNLEEANLLVPLVMAWPRKLPPGSRVATQVRSIDILPTILELLGLPIPEGIDGVSLVGLATGKTTEPAAPALTYAPHRNLGLSVRIQNRAKYVFNDAVWSRAPDHERYFDLLADPLGRRNLLRDLAADERRRLLEVVREALAEIPGVRVRLSAAPHAPLRGVLLGRFDSSEVKTPGPPCDCIDWRGRGRVAFDVPAGGVVTLCLQRPAEESLRVKIRGEGERELAGRKASDPWVLPGGAELRSWWQGLRFAREETGAPDPRVVEQLRALGYVQ